MALLFRAGYFTLLTFFMTQYSLILIQGSILANERKIVYFVFVDIHNDVNGVRLTFLTTP